MKNLLFLALLLPFVSCNKTEEQPTKTYKEYLEEQQVIGRYVYLDTKGILHTDDECVRYDLDECMGLMRIPLNQLTTEEVRYCCPRCVCDKTWEKLNNTANNNQQKDSIIN